MEELENNRLVSLTYVPKVMEITLLKSISNTRTR